MIVLNKEKTQTMMMKGKFSANRHPIISMGDTSLKYENKVKYLGVTVGEKLNFLPHLETTKAKLVTVVGQVRRILRAEWGLSGKSVWQVYKGLFVAYAIYVSSTSGEGCREKQLKGRYCLTSEF